MKDLLSYYATAIHVGHIVELLKFDEQIHLGGAVQHLKAIALGFADFSAMWNTGVCSDDTRRISKFFVAIPMSTSSGLPQFLYSSITLLLHQNKPASPSTFAALPLPVYRLKPAEITQEFAAIMLRRQQNYQRGYEERPNKRTRMFESGTRFHSQMPNSKPKRSTKLNSVLS